MCWPFCNQNWKTVSNQLLLLIKLQESKFNCSKDLILAWPQGLAEYMQGSSATTASILASHCCLGWDSNKTFFLLKTKNTMSLHDHGFPELPSCLNCNDFMRKDNRIGFYCLLHGLEFRIVLILDWLLPKAHYTAI